MSESASPPVTFGKVARDWWPLAASWLLMAVELPVISAVVARLTNPEVHLAAYGGVVFPIALIVEAPIIMMLAASTALSRDHAAYDALRRFMHKISIGLTSIHLLIAFTPLYDLIVVRLMEVPPEVVEPARIGLQIMTPWTWSIAYRRFNQGVLIRFGHARAVGVGTVVRLLSVTGVLTFGYLQGDIIGIVVATSAVAVGVLSEAAYAGIRVRPVVATMAPEDRARPPLRGRPFLRFYVPLAMTSLITLIVMPIGSAAISRMPAALESLAVWPILNGLLFMLQSLGLAYNEVVVALLGRPWAARRLWRFSLLLGAATTVLIMLIAGTPLSAAWFEGVSGLSPVLADMAAGALWIALPIPACRALQSWYQGVLVHVHRTAPITESVVVFLIGCCLVLLVGIGLQRYQGLDVAVVAFAVGRIVQTAWLALRSRGARREVRQSVAVHPEPAPA